VILQNPADVLVYVQLLPLALLPNPSVFSGKLADRWDHQAGVLNPDWLSVI